jgi:amino acid transporter
LPSARTTAAGRLGTFAGVFTPSVPTILGLIPFRRLGYAVGAGGMGQALVILLIAHAISILTSASLPAIATNLRVKGGGDHCLISRSLGVEFGGALVEDYEAMPRVAVLPVLITVGTVAATLSSALASCMGAPRILQALARDRVFPPLLPFAAGSGPADNPRRGVLLTLAIALEARANSPPSARGSAGSTTAPAWSGRWRASASCS